MLANEQSILVSLGVLGPVSIIDLEGTDYPSKEKLCKYDQFSPTCSETRHPTKWTLCTTQFTTHLLIHSNPNYITKS